MKKSENFPFQTGLSMFACLALSTYSAAENEIKVRVHVPYPERLENEFRSNFVTRIENRGQDSLPLVWRLTDEDLKLGKVSTEHIQFILQTKSGTGEVSLMPSFKWSNISDFADSSVGPNQAIELVTADGMNLPEQGGEFRFAFKIGPDKLVYSNWVNLVIHPAQDASQWPVLATAQVFPGEIGIYDFLVGVTPSGKWLFERPLWNKNIFHRRLPLFELPPPKIETDTERSQATFIFEKKSASTIYYNANVGLNRSTPWPKGNSGGDFNNKPMPVDAPSPMEFPLSLFGDGRPDKPAEANPEGKPVSLKGNAAQSVNRPTGPTSAAAESLDRWGWWASAAGLTFLLLLLSFWFKSRQSPH